MIRPSAIPQIVTVLLIAFSILGCSGVNYTEVRFRGPKHQYALDDESRALKNGKCPLVQTVSYEGYIVKYHRPVKVNPFFRQRLIEFEKVVDETARDILGESPTSIKHFGTYNCRRIRGKNKMSEHGLANAIDVSGFTFARFDISVERDWRDSGTKGLFLNELAVRLAHRPDIFRGILGPGAPGHHDHFHFDCGRSQYVRVHVSREVMEK